MRRIPYGGATIAYALVEFDLGGFTERIMPDGAALVIGSGQGVLYAAGTETAGPELFSAAARDGSFALGEHRYTAHLNALRLPGLQVLVGVATLISGAASANKANLATVQYQIPSRSTAS